MKRRGNPLMEHQERRTTRYHAALNMRDRITVRDQASTFLQTSLHPFDDSCGADGGENDATSGDVHGGGIMFDQLQHPCSDVLKRKNLVGWAVMIFCPHDGCPS